MVPSCWLTRYLIQTALHKATLHGYLEIVVYLLSIPDRKADVHARDADGWTPLHNACAKVGMPVAIL